MLPRVAMVCVLLAGGFYLSKRNRKTKAEELKPNYLVNDPKFLPPSYIAASLAKMDNSLTSESLSSPPEEEHPAMKYGYPSTNNLIHREGYVLSYDPRTRNAAWVCQHLTEEHLTNKSGNVTREGSSFKEDDTIPVQFRAKLSDYKDSGYDRGHLTPAADHKASQAAMDETFYLSNVSPQVGPGFNRHYWARLEQFVRDLLKDWTDVYICTGPLWLPVSKQIKGKRVWVVEHEVIGDPPLVAVPDSVAIGAFIIPNDKIPPSHNLTRYSVSKDLVDVLAGVTFFPKAPPVALPTNKSDNETTTWKETTPSSEKVDLALPVPSPTIEEEAKTEISKIAADAQRLIALTQELCSLSECVLPPSDFWTPATATRKAELQRIIDDFNASEALEFTFPADLTPAERKFVHQSSENVGLGHLSVGPPHTRQIVISKPVRIEQPVVVLEVPQVPERVNVEISA